MVELGRDPDLIEEPLGAEDRGQLGADDLERDLALMAEITGQVHRGHPTRTQLSLDRVAIDESEGQPGELLTKRQGTPNACD